MEHFLTPMLALIVWTFVIWWVLFIRRVPAMNAVTKDAQEFIRNPALMDTLPDKAKWVGDNYDHLHEQPVLFYALMVYLYLTKQGDQINLYLAWGYMGSRVVHSLIQTTSNKVLARFGVFVIGSLLLMIMAGRAVIALY